MRQHGYGFSDTILSAAARAPGEEWLPPGSEG